MTRLQTLIQLTQTLGQPHLQYVIIGEGNTSFRLDDNSFYIKASGQQMHNITANGFVQVQFEPILKLFDTPELSLEEQKIVAQSAVINSDSKPSIEVSFHAMLLHDCNVQYIGHTHPTAINQILCSNRAEQFASNRTFPDEVVLCGPESVLVPYEDPGLPLAMSIRNEVNKYIDKYGEAPKVILLKNHGFIALGQSPAEILNITAMSVKSAQIFVGACSIGEPVFLSLEEIQHIYQRPDEIYRRKLFMEENT